VSDLFLMPGEYFIISDKLVMANPGRRTTRVSVSNTGSRPVQVGSHTHFFEVNKALSFPREKAYGFHLNIPAGTSLRFEPGDTREVELVEYGGRKIVHGFSGLVNGKLSAAKKKEALAKARARGFAGA
jgi:urease subunit beta